MNGTIIVCGDSYMSPVVHHPGKHFSELVADRLGFELVAYSRGGMSNGGIALQIETAIEKRPSLILVGFSFPDRVEYPVKDDDGTYDLTADNILYEPGHSLSTAQKHVGNDPKLVSTNIHELLDPTSEETWAHNYKNVWNAHLKRDIIVQWFHNIYYRGWHTKLNSYLVYALLHKLHLSGIPYIVCFDFIGAVNKCPWLYTTTENGTKPVIENACDNFVQHLNNDGHPLKWEDDPGFHTSFECQRRMALDVLQRSKRLLNL